ncbi:sigma-70 family RNA polymerase sigma factor [Congzhengia minquanensis]|uniref:Sigma-70 family RNA polymerase sigma factor n=1 Tax=Congzhengia minquanensis TaxID=2763657 RepID=A0A926DN32_9FIRM|nr:sigma-70 family RNA polymerase sigma factor [Congzhengia minquanensis]MBC8540714.1 sigma-70 family RNA polymerase sigma factor [Congzhengia minquanensis]
MKYTDEQKEHIRHCFDSFCKKVIRYQAINLYRGNSKYIERNVSFEEILNDYFLECGKCDTYPILQYHFEAFGYIFSVNDYDLGKALLQLPKKKRDVILMYYFTDYKLKDIAEMIGKSQKNISYIHVRALKNLREIMEGGEDE